MKPFIFEFLVISLISLISLSKSNSCKELLGSWKVYKTQLSFGSHSNNDGNIWTFESNGNLKINEVNMKYKLDANCQKIIIGNNSTRYSILRLTSDTLFIRYNVLPHESASIYLKRIQL